MMPASRAGPYTPDEGWMSVPCGPLGTKITNLQIPQIANFAILHFHLHRVLVVLNLPIDLELETALVREVK